MFCKSIYVYVVSVVSESSFGVTVCGVPIIHVEQTDLLV